MLLGSFFCLNFKIVLGIIAVIKQHFRDFKL